MSPFSGRLNFPKSPPFACLELRRGALSVPRHVSPHCWYQQQRRHQGQILVASYITILRDLHCHHIPKLDYEEKLTLARNACIECQTSTFSAPGASIRWKGIRLTNLAACKGESSRRSATIGAIREHTGL